MRYDYVFETIWIVLDECNCWDDQEADVINSRNIQIFTSTPTPKKVDFAIQLDSKTWNDKQSSWSIPDEKTTQLQSPNLSLESSEVPTILGSRIFK